MTVNYRPPLRKNGLYPYNPQAKDNPFSGYQPFTLFQPYSLGGATAQWRYMDNIAEGKMDSRNYQITYRSFAGAPSDI